ncbi:MAG: caspase family protein [Proteobacteria bacterium]|nr:caspase family protein [Pseudomonadota bacterium]
MMKMLVVLVAALVAFVLLVPPTDALAHYTGYGHGHGAYGSRYGGNGPLPGNDSPYGAILDAIERNPVAPPPSNTQPSINRDNDASKPDEAAPAARGLTRGPAEYKAPPSTPIKYDDKIDFGNYHALVIGINDYKYLPKLKMATVDAKAVAKVLKEDYGFKVTLLLNPDHGKIIDSFDEYREKLGPMDNLLIYYAGHGWLDEDSDRGYWLPVDAKKNRRSRWVSNAIITDTLKALGAKHVMLVVDSCFSGSLVRSAEMGTRKRIGDYWKKMAGKWARVAITSGGLEPVADKGGGDNSPFAKAFIDALGENESLMDGTTLFSRMRRPVMIAADQTPQYSDVRKAGHDGGDFLFVRKN